MVIASRSSDLNLKEVKAWARANDVRVDIVREDVDPTQTEVTAD